jgi:hypothetical protein
MSKTEILAELPRLTPEERREIMDKLAGLEELHLLRGGEPSEAEKTMLDEALAEYRRDPQAGRPWREVLAGLRAQRSR